MRPCSAWPPPHHGHSLTVLFLLFLLWRFADTVPPPSPAPPPEYSSLQPLQLRISQSAKQQYDLYREATCRKKETYRSVNAYLHWEENTFLQELRSTLLPQTTNGDFSSLYGKPELDIIDYRMMQTREKSLCAKKNASAGGTESVLTEKTDFEDAVYNSVFHTPDHFNEQRAFESEKRENASLRLLKKARAD